MRFSDQLWNLYHYKLRTAIDLAYRREFGYLLGVLSEKATGQNVYLDWLRRRGHDLTADREILGHKMTLDLSDPGLSRYLISRGVNEPNATPAFAEALEKAVADHGSDDVAVLDVGANIGYFALLEAEIVGEDGIVYAFEPAPSNRDLLERNVRQNGYENRIEIRPCAIGDSDGSAQLVLSDHSNWHRVAVGPEDEGEERIAVDTRRVDSFLSEESIDPESVVGVRMDVEGYEAAIFEGMNGIFEADSPAVIFVELHPSELSDDELDQILSHLAESGFTVEFAGQDRKTFELNDPREVRSIGGSHVRLVLRRR